MKTSDIELKKGDYVVHSAHGVGKVMGVENKELNGKKKKLYRIKTNNFVYWIPVKKTAGKKIRKVSSPHTFQNMLSLIRKRPKIIARQYRSRKKQVSSALKTPSLRSRARMIRDLYGRQIRKDLNFNDQLALEKLKKNFIEEWSVSAGIDKATAKKKLDMALRKSASCIKAES